MNTTANNTQHTAGIVPSEVDAVFTHINFQEFNAACDRFLRARVPGYAKTWQEASDRSAKAWQKKKLNNTQQSQNHGMA
jgi:hypothetical protein